MENVVTGGCGFIGSHLVDALLSRDEKVVVIDNLSVGRKSNLGHVNSHPNLSIIEGDINNKQLVRSLISPGSRVFHLAALADIVPSVQNPEDYFHANVNGTFSVLEACREVGVNKLIYVASSSCYGIPQIVPTDEAAEIKPMYPYALTKWIGESVCMHWSALYSIPTISLRFF